MKNYTFESNLPVPLDGTLDLAPSGPSPVLVPSEITRLSMGVDCIDPDGAFMVEVIIWGSGVVLFREPLIRGTTGFSTWVEQQINITWVSVAVGVGIRLRRIEGSPIRESLFKSILVNLLVEPRLEGWSDDPFDMGRIGAGCPVGEAR